MTDEVAHGRGADVFFDGLFVTLVRHRARSFESGVTRMPAAMITGVQWREAAKARSGLLQFTTTGGADSMIGAGFDRAQQPAFAQLKAAVEQAIAHQHDPAGRHGNVAADLATIAALMREHLLTPDEYLTAKQRVLDDAAAAAEQGSAA